MLFAWQNYFKSALGNQLCKSEAFTTLGTIP